MLLKYIYSKLTEILNYFCSPSSPGTLTLKPASFEVVYLDPVAINVSGERILITNQLLNIEQLLNTNAHFFKENNSIYNFPIDNRINSELPPILNTCNSKTLEGNIFIFINLHKERYIIVGNQRWGNLISLSGLSHFIAKKK